MSPAGPELSVFVQGYWRMDEWGMNPQQRLRFIKQHVELGISTVDHAAVYGSPACELLFGEALKLDPSLRADIEIISKCGINLAGAETNNKIAHYESTKKRIVASVDKSLSQLGVDYPDGLLIHRPDFLMDADEIAQVFSDLSISGKVKYFGVSNFTPSQVSLLQSRLNEPLLTNQVEINPLNMQVIEDGTLDQLQQMRVRPLAWSCLAGGRVFTEQSEQMLRLRTTLAELADELGGASMEAILYAWTRKLPSNPLVLLGSGKINRTQIALESLDLSLTHEQWYRVWVASKGQDVP
ncbi:MAG: aldo/keto reductase [Spongiibacteraceae bacterium]|nr:aldo/keto reductase [Spongiibacteraceae bacterium]